MPIIEEPRRADLALCAAGLAQSRERARQLIEARLAFCDGAVIDKPSRKIAPGATLEVRGEVCPYVSRGGFKLEKALRVLGVRLAFCIASSPGILHPSPTNPTGGQTCQ